jgi:hypothetical protein
MLLLGLLYNGLIFLIGLGTAGLKQASGEVLPKYGGELPFLGALWGSMEMPESEAARAKSNTRQASQRPARQRQQFLALIISAKAQAIADRVLKEMKRGVTALHGEGMYTHQNREVLMVAATVTEIPQLKALVSAEDPNAFVVVTPAREILGRGFQPLTEA